MSKLASDERSWDVLLVMAAALVVAVGCSGNNSAVNNAGQGETAADPEPKPESPVVIDLDSPLGESLTTTPEKRKSDEIVKRWRENDVRCEMDDMGKDVISIVVPAGAADDVLRGSHEVTSLKSVTLAEDCAITDSGLAHLTDCNSLESLRLNAAKGVSLEGLKSIAKISSLRDLDVSGLRIGSESLDVLGEHGGLRELNLSWTAVGDDVLGKMSQLPTLESLDLSFTRISDAELDSLLGLSELTYLNLEGTRVSEKAVARLREKSPRLLIDGFDVEVIEKPEDAPKDKPADAAKDKPADPPKEKPKDKPADKPAEPPKDKPTDEAKDKAKDKPSDAPKEESKEKPADTPEKKSADSPKDKQ